MLINNNYFPRLVILFFLLLFGLPIQPKIAFGQGSHIKVFVSILPQSYFLERIGGNLVEVHTLLPPGASPATYEPSPKQIAKLTLSKLYFSIGVNFEKAVIPKIKLAIPNCKIIDTQKGIKLREMVGHNHHGQEHHGSKDPHIWLDPLLVKKQALTIANALIDISPTNKDVFNANLKKFSEDLDLVHNRINQLLQPIKGKDIIVFHPSFGYFADAYGLKQKPIEAQGKSPSSKQLTNIIKYAKKQEIKTIFVQKQFSKKNAEVIAREIGGVVVPLDPLAKDYITNLENIAKAIKQALH